MKICPTIFILLLFLLPINSASFDRLRGKSKSRPTVGHFTSDDEVEAAFENLKSFQSLPKFTGLPAADRQKFRADFMPQIRNLRVDNDPQRNRRATNLAAKVFKIHSLTSQCETVVLVSGLPTVLTWKSTFITFTTAVLRLLSDEELIALTAHEVGHLYYIDELRRARDTKDDRLARIIELKVDIIALETLDRLSLPHSDLLSAIAKLIKARDALGVMSITGMSPSFDDRTRLISEYEKRKTDKTLFKN